MKQVKRYSALLLTAALLVGLLAGAAVAGDKDEAEQWKTLVKVLGDEVHEFGALAQTMKAYFELGELSMKQGKFDRAIECYHEVLARREKLFSYKVPEQLKKDLTMLLTEIYTRIAGAYAKSGRIEEAEKFLLNVLEQGNLAPSQKSKIYMDMGVFYKETGQFEKAEEALLKVIEVNKDILGKTD